MTTETATETQDWLENLQKTVESHPGVNHLLLCRAATHPYTRADYKGEAMNQAPDISLGYNRKYQSAKSAAKGAVVPGLFEPNEDKWSGEHAAADMAWCPGIFFSNQKVEEPDPNIMDLGVTALSFLGADVPSDFEGNSLA